MRVPCSLPALLAAVLIPASAFAANDRTIALHDGALSAELRIANGHLVSETVSDGRTTIAGDGGFAVDVVFNDWRAPGKANNGDIEAHLTAKDFEFTGDEARQRDGHAEHVLHLLGPETSGDYKKKARLQLDLVYRLDGKGPWLRRRMELSDTSGNNHLLDAATVVDETLAAAPTSVVKAGGFSQPAAWTQGDGGAFFGLEWPAADIALDGAHLRAREIYGKVIGKEPLATDWSVLGLTPDARVKLHFFRYVDSIRVGKLRPYTLYNTWYDLRTKEYQKRLPSIRDDQIMNEDNVRRLIGAVRTNMIEKHGIKLDAFVLDDGWDTYKSAWGLRQDMFPRGLKPLADTLKQTGTALGVWFGPTGGYSFRNDRVGWFRDNGYEVTGNDMLCVAGHRYADLFDRRVREMTADGVGYFKWDGFQFACNDPGQDHPIGVYARRAGLDNVERFANDVRKADPSMFLNITSGTWLSPWWLRFADQIWMDGEDFGSASASSISTRDSSITYRDMVLTEDFRDKDLWFPLSNLMTHGILKGRIDIGDIGRNEPLSKFSDEVVFYLARGVSMYELYLSPDLLDDNEWRVLADALAWARVNFDVLSAPAFMLGGDVRKSEPYGYAHWRGSRGLLAVRNPDVSARTMHITLDPQQGLDPAVKDLVVERLYPDRWIAPKLHRAGDGIEVPLDGYEAAVYAVHPRGNAKDDVPAGLVYTTDVQGHVTPLRTQGELHWLGDARRGVDIAALEKTLAAPQTLLGSSTQKADGQHWSLAFDVADTARETRIGLLVKPGQAKPEDRKQKRTAPTAILDGQLVELDRVDDDGGAWTWFTVPVKTGAHTLDVDFSALPSAARSIQAWASGDLAAPTTSAKLTTAAPKGPQLPSARAVGSYGINQHIGDTSLPSR